MSSLNSYRAGEADRCAVGSSDLEATPSIIIAQRACPAESEPVHPSQASSYWHDVVDVEPDPDQETEHDTTAVIATRSPVGYWRQFVIATLANCAQTERYRPNEKKPPEFPWCRSSRTHSRKPGRRIDGTQKSPPGSYRRTEGARGAFKKDELCPSQLTKGEAHKNLAVKRPTAMAAGRGMGTTAAIGTAAAAAATAEIAQYGG